MTMTRHYEVGQIWEYRSREGEEGSLLKIQEISQLGPGDNPMLVYHVSIIGVRLGPNSRIKEISHVPLSTETLDVSVTALSPLDPEFPDPEEGMEIWREDEGGVFTLPVAEIVNIFDETITRRPGSHSAN